MKVYQLLILSLLCFTIHADSNSTNSTTNTTSGWTKEATINFTMGILVGASDQQNLTYLADCLEDVTILSYYYYEAMTALKQGGFMMTQDALHYVGLAVQSTTETMASCKAAKEMDFDELDEMAAVFKQPWSLIVNDMKYILVNRKEITAELMEAKLYVNDGDYYEAG